MEHLLALISIMVFCGLLGGLVNFWSAAKPQIESELHPLLKRLSAGLAASFAVPLFLNMISSSLVTDSKSDQLKLLIIAGFCIIASVSSKAFIDTLTKKLINQIEKIDEEQKTLRKDVEPVLVKETEPEPLSSQITFADRYDLNEDDKKILKELADPKWSMRSTKGIVEATGFKDIKAIFSLEKLCGLGLTRKNLKDNVHWWWLTSEGRILAKEFGLL